jgi:hypothetical protein
MTQKSFSSRTNRPLYELSDLALDRVSLVPSGDDPMAHVVLAKSDKSNTSRSSAHTMHDQSGGRGVTDAKHSVIKKDDLPPEVVEYIEALEDSVDVLGAEITKAHTALAKTKAKKDDGSDDDSGVDDDDTDDNGGDEPGDDADGDDGGDDTDDDDDSADDSDDKKVKKGAKVKATVLSKADPETRAYIEKMEADNREAVKKANARIAEAETIAKAERDLRIQREAVTKAQTLPMIAEDPNELAELLIALEGTPEGAKVEKLLMAANEAISKGNLFSEMGRTGAGVTSGNAVEAAASELRKADPNLTPEQAIAKAYETNPDLYDEDVRAAADQRR